MPIVFSDDVFASNFQHLPRTCFPYPAGPGMAEHGLDSELRSFCRDEAEHAIPAGSQHPPTTNPQASEQFPGRRIYGRSGLQQRRSGSHLAPGHIGDEILAAGLPNGLLVIQHTSSWKCQVCVGSLSKTVFLFMSVDEPKMPSSAFSFGPC